MNTQGKTKSKSKSLIKECMERLKAGKLPPWKVEDEIETNRGIRPPENFKKAALCRQQFIEDVTGERFKYIGLSD